MDRISTNISAKEGVHSDTATKRNIKNVPNASQLKSMKLLAEKVFEPLRKNWNVAIAITSFFRSVELNKLIGGSSTSQHCKGEAFDLDADRYGNLENQQIFNFIKDNLDFDQLIWEFGNDTNPDWVHVSYKAKGNRKQILKAIIKDGKVKYIPYKVAA